MGSIYSFIKRTLLCRLHNPTSMRGYTYCPYVGIFHNKYNHITEIDKCEICGLTTICDVNCESPWNSKLHRICKFCGGDNPFI